VIIAAAIVNAAESNVWSPPWTNTYMLSGWLIGSTSKR
jgi:hypothetical protein